MPPITAPPLSLDEMTREQIESLDHQERLDAFHQFVLRTTERMERHLVGQKAPPSVRTDLHLRNKEIMDDPILQHLIAFELDPKELAMVAAFGSLWHVKEYLYAGWTERPKLDDWKARYAFRAAHLAQTLHKTLESDYPSVLRSRFDSSIGMHEQSPRDEIRPTRDISASTDSSRYLKVLGSLTKVRIKNMIPLIAGAVSAPVCMALSKFLAGGALSTPLSYAAPVAFVGCLVSGAMILAPYKFSPPYRNVQRMLCEVYPPFASGLSALKDDIISTYAFMSPNGQINVDIPAPKHLDYLMTVYPTDAQIADIFKKNRSSNGGEMSKSVLISAMQEQPYFAGFNAICETLSLRKLIDTHAPADPLHTKHHKPSVRL